MRIRQIVFLLPLISSLLLFGCVYESGERFPLTHAEENATIGGIGGALIGCGASAAFGLPCEVGATALGGIGAVTGWIIGSATDSRERDERRILAARIKADEEDAIHRGVGECTYAISWAQNSPDSKWARTITQNCSGKYRYYGLPTELPEIILRPTPPNPYR